MKSMEDFRRDFGRAVYDAEACGEAFDDAASPEGGLAFDPSDPGGRDAEKRERLLRRCRERCLYLITDAEKTEARLREKLRASGRYPEDIIDEAMDFLKSYDFLNDRRFAERLIQRYAGTKSLREIEQKLYQRGVRREDVQAALSAYREEGELAEARELAAVQKLIRKKCRSAAELSREERQKLLQSIMRRGFSYGLVSRALDLSLEEA